ncbi:MAG: hypothetical protein LBF41_00730 [Deltaproteobacteria bacterium]|jgi:AAA15 family ATPase/GTPase|nr:hypothetical protein [Deltaproteobacteria bacterium]
MLLKFTVENFLTFKDKTIFSMTANGGGKNLERIQSHEGYAKRVLPFAGIFGGEDSGSETFVGTLGLFGEMVTGKTNFVDDLKTLTFRKRDAQGDLPAKMGAEILVGDRVLRYGFMAVKGAVVNERLVEISDKTAQTVFERRKKKIKFHRRVQDAEGLALLFKHMPKNELFATHAAKRAKTVSRELARWFDRVLHAVGPGTRPTTSSGGNSPDVLPPDGGTLSAFIEALDRSPLSARLHARVVPKNNPLWNAVKNPAPAGPGELRETGEARGNGEFLVRADKNAGTAAVFHDRRSIGDHKLLQVWPRDFGETDKERGWERFVINKPFGSEKEKQRLVTLMCLADMTASPEPRLYALNRFENAFDLIKTRTLLSDFLGNLTKDSRSQFIVSTSNALLLDKKVLRPDEIWITEPGEYGNTMLASLPDFRKRLKSKPVWQGIDSNTIGGIYTTLLMAALEVNR